MSEVEKQTIPHGMREIHFNTHVVNSNVLNQFVTDEKKKCPIILWQGSLDSNLLVKICYDHNNNFCSLISGQHLRKIPEKYSWTHK